MGLINISICLSDLPKDKIKQAANGKKYINLCISERKETGKYGETHTLFVSQTKEEREEQQTVTYVGSGIEYAPKPVTQQDINNAPVSDNNDDLPF
jgi:hypothetical protein